MIYTPIDCTEILTKSMVKKMAHTRISEIDNKKISLQRINAMFWNMNKISEKSNPSIRHQTSKSQLRNILQKNFSE